MARCAVVQSIDNLVVNIIIAEQQDPAPDGCFLIDIDNFPNVDIGWFYDPVMQDFYPPPPPEETAPPPPLQPDPEIPPPLTEGG